MRILARTRCWHSFMFSTLEEDGNRGLSLVVAEWPCCARPTLHSGHSSRDASTNLLCIHHLKLVELQSWGLGNNHCVGNNHRVSLATTEQ
jgi:hypothetical protein